MEQVQTSGEIELINIAEEEATIPELAKARVEPAPANVDAAEHTTMKQETSTGNSPTPLESYTGLDWYIAKWNVIFAISCVLAISIDPLLLYIPLVNEDRKCIRSDEKLMITFLVLRSLTDAFYIIDILLQIFTRPVIHAYEALRETPRTVDKEDALSGGRNSINRTWRFIFVVDILAVAPFPYMILFLFRGMLLRNPGGTIIFVFNYGVRISRIYLVCEQLKKDASIETLFFWAKLVLKFSMFLVASHVLGSLWYLFSFQEEMRCWQLACQKETGCGIGVLRCKYQASTNRTFLKDLCPINPSNSTVYDFGIYLDALQSGMLESTKFLPKILHCFWWGLQHLSSFGSNLKTSANNVGESLFAIFIAISGMVLFLIYLTAIIQKYIKLAAAKDKEYQKELAIETKRREKELAHKKQRRKKRLPEIASWLDENSLPAELKEKIMENVIHNLSPDLEVNTKNLHLILRLEDIRNVKYQLCLRTLKNVPVLGSWDEGLLKALCEYLRPVIYDEGTYVFREGEPIDRMVFITKGNICAYTITRNSEARSPSNTVKVLGSGEFLGEDIILHWETEEATSSSYLPFSKINVTCSTEVEAFILKPEVLRNVLVEWVQHCSKQMASSSNTRLMEHPPRQFSDLLRHVREIQIQKKETSEEILENMLIPPTPHAVEEWVEKD